MIKLNTPHSGAFRSPLRALESGRSEGTAGADVVTGAHGAFAGTHGVAGAYGAESAGVAAGDCSSAGDLGVTEAQGEYRAMPDIPARPQAAIPAKILKSYIAQSIIDPTMHAWAHPPGRLVLERLNILEAQNLATGVAPH